MSYISYISFPSKIEHFALPDDEGAKINESGVYCVTERYLGYEKNIYIFLSAGSSRDDICIEFYEDTDNAAFTNCFINPFIFRFDLESMPNSDERYFEIVRGDLDNESKISLQNKIHAEEEFWQRQGLHGFLHHILSEGEFVEIYTGWEAWGDYNFGPPSIESCINLDDLLNYEIVKSLRDIMSSAGSSKGGQKLKIFKAADSDK
ncbi:MAG: hypothetical protein FWE11_05940 [Defluviitaleaceae bacterium]|nr:hypothetical protein [Defluviitaleaceae bacterium]